MEKSIVDVVYDVVVQHVEYEI